MGCSVAPLTIDVLFGILDADGSGSLDEAEILGIMRRKFSIGKGQEQDWVDFAQEKLRTTIRHVRNFFDTL